jgi:hypothetical protein
MNSAHSFGALVGFRLFSALLKHSLTCLPMMSLHKDGIELIEVLI